MSSGDEHSGAETSSEDEDEEAMIYLRRPSKVLWGDSSALVRLTDLVQACR
jgi:hypothetical protein